MSESFERQLKRLVRNLENSPAGDLFNPYRDRHPEIDRADAARRRRHNLRTYLETFRRARWVMIGEAAGYNGCRFTGIPFTGEDLLVGEDPLPWARGKGLLRASKREKLSSEMSAKIVWGGIGTTKDIVLWNAVPWHPHKPGDLMSNRKPRRDEVRAGLELLQLFLETFPKAEPVAVGRVSQDSLAEIGIDARYVRHPSMGGKPAFLKGLEELRS